MKIKQQKQIKAFLIEEFGESKANTLFHSQEKTLDTLIENTKNKSENQMKTLDRKSTRLNSSHRLESRMPSSA